MKQDIVIIGAGNVGGFLAYNVEEFGDFNVLGFLDDDIDKQGKKFYSSPVLGQVEYLNSLLQLYPALGIVIGIANPKVKASIFNNLESLGLNFPSMVSKNAWISKTVSIGQGCIIYPGVSINYECQLEDFVIMNMNCAIGHNCTISKFSTLAPSVSLAGFTYLEEGVDMGINSATIQSVRIGSYSRIGGMGMVTNEIPGDCTAVGVPAKVLLNK